MASFSSVSSNSLSSSSIISITSPDSNTSREATPEFDPIASYEDLAPLHWDAEEWDYSTWSEDDEPLTDDEDLQILLHGDVADFQLQKATGTPTTIPVMMAATAAAATMAAATTTLVRPPRSSATRP
jgi:hypothetical protein